VINIITLGIMITKNRRVYVHQIVSSIQLKKKQKERKREREREEERKRKKENER